MRRRLAIAATAALLLGIGAVVFVGAGAYNVAATTPHARVTHWLMHTTMERSVAARADDIPAPPKLDSAAIRRGFAEYDEMCVACHGAPGVDPGVFGEGLNPAPPDLAKKAGEWNDRELYWILKNGIKMTGMPAFGATHSDTTLWSIVAATRQLQYMSAQDYQRTVAEAGAHRGMHAAVTESAGETEPSAGAHAHPEAQPATSTRSGAARGVEHAGMDHSRMVGATERRVRQQPTVPHEQHPRPISRAASERLPVAPARGDVESTEKLKTLAAELLRDPIVIERIRADSALRQRWQRPAVQKQLASP